MCLSYKKRNKISFGRKFYQFNEIEKNLFKQKLNYNYLVNLKCFYFYKYILHDIDTFQFALKLSVLINIYFIYCRNGG